MMGYRQGKLAWSDPGFFPVESKLASAKDGIVLVDVGGGKGHDLMDLQAKFPAFKGRLILQDKPEVIAEAKSDLAGDIDAQGHDFFTEQPVRGKYLKLLITYRTHVENAHNVLQEHGHTICTRSYMIGTTRAASRSLKRFGLP